MFTAWRWRVSPIVVAVLVHGLWAVAAGAQGVYRVGAPAAWVKPIPVAVAPSQRSSGVTDGYEILLVDDQEAVRDGVRERYYHLAYRLLDEGAVQEYSQVTVVVDSSYQRLTLHSVTVTRDGRRIDQLKPDRIRVMQRESQAEYQIYDGSVSVVLLLEDVRRGDIVEYSYSLRGSNPVYAGHFTSAVSLQQDVPLHRFHFRLLWPRERPLFITRYQTDLEPVVRDDGPYREYVWDQAFVPAKVLEADLPSWYRPFPQVQLSDFASWAQVGAWGDSLFAHGGPVPPALTAEIARIRVSSPSTEVRVLAALRFVQDEVRYLGIEIGVNSHVPYSPATVLKRRYGDCKDKAQLLTVMLHELGVVARPALVSTTLAGHIRDFHPTSGIFDHAIVEAEIGGRTYWLDPTALYQRDDLDGVTPPFGAALVLGSKEDSLSPMPRTRPAQPLSDIAVSFSLGGVGAPAAMQVESKYRGRMADAMRASIRSTPRSQLQKQYENFYAALYPSLRTEGPLEVNDDEAANLIRTTERYSVPDFWRWSETQRRNVGTFSPRELAEAIPGSIATTRTMPLGLRHPTHLRYTIEAHLKDGWFIEPRTEMVEAPAFRFAYHRRAKGDALTLTYEYEGLSDFVAPDAVAKHGEQASRVAKLMSLTVTAPDSTAADVDWLSPQELNWPILLTALFVAGFAVVGAMRVNRLQLVSWPHNPETGDGAGPAGLGGWLVLVGILISLQPVVMLWSTLKTAPNFAATNWAQLTAPGGLRYNALLAPTLLFELVWNVALTVFAFLQVRLFFSRRRVFPAVFVVVMAARLLANLLDTVVANAIRGSGTDSGAAEGLRGALLTIMWIGYMFRSRRVRNTFTT